MTKITIVRQLLFSHQEKDYFIFWTNSKRDMGHSSFCFLVSKVLYGNFFHVLFSFSFTSKKQCLGNFLQWRKQYAKKYTTLIFDFQPVFLFGVFCWYNSGAQICRRHPTPPNCSVSGESVYESELCYNGW